ncbi:uncharacterized protein C8Q71DRAFT_720382 [Rhodofomes roseus]|uniref:DUF6533 domain-containing protein n=1 Tax=Rhodofomes roseus TaxID=34475 RepID=A0ABQ8KW15_9APHY|nr:uncharacterized protein C8Q71DRAFT_720382 [Rhodofomes roseus]KAH9842996.1 hypothetical protein C8Q71DRAFT_720382 [Rhodofomes roseus]
MARSNNSRRCAALLKEFKKESPFDSAPSSGYEVQYLLDELFCARFLYKQICVAIDAFETFFVTNCLIAAATTLYVYDRCISLDQEIELVWRRRLSVATIVYVLMHVSLLVNIVTIVALLVVTGCDRVYPRDYRNSMYNNISLGHRSWQKLIHLYAAISALRVYAINGRAIGVPSAIILLFLMYTSYDFYNACSLYKLKAPPPVGCLILTSMRPTAQHADCVERLSGLRIAGIVCAIVAEVLVLVATWRATYKVRQMVNDSSMRRSVSGLLLRDGTIYFGMIVILFIIGAIFEYTVESLDRLQAICITRLYVNLRHAASSTGHTSPSGMYEVEISRVLGSLDRSLVFVPSDLSASEETDSHYTLDTIASMGVKFDNVEMTDMANLSSSFDYNVTPAPQLEAEVEVAAAHVVTDDTVLIHNEV